MQHIQSGLFVAFALALGLSCAPKKQSTSTPGTQTVQSGPIENIIVPDVPTEFSVPTNPGANGLLIEVSNPDSVTGAEVQCPSGERERKSLVRNPNTGSGYIHFTQLPDEDCVLHFKGGTPAKYRPVTAGAHLRCDLVGTTAVCSGVSEAQHLSTARRRPFRDELLVYLTEPGGNSSVDVVCPGGHRRWAPITQGTANLDGLPMSEACILYFKGTSPAEYRPVHGGLSLSCRVSVNAAACSVDQFDTPPPRRDLVPLQIQEAQVRVQLPQTDATNAVELVCVGGYRKRVEVGKLTAVTFDDVPTEDCSLLFKGAIPAKYAPVKPGAALTCGFVGTTAVCHQTLVEAK